MAELFNEDVPVAKADQEIGESHGFHTRGNFMSVADPFEEDGVTYEAWQPRNDQAPRVMVVEAYRDGLRVARREVPMYHENRWGIDVEDVDSLEAATEQLIKEVKAGA